MSLLECPPSQFLICLLVVDYKVGSNGTGYSKVFHFKTLNTGTQWNPHIAIYGDLGIQNDKSVPFLRKDVSKDMYDVIFHIGDIAYNLNEAGYT